MNCGNWEERIALYAGGEADAAETAAVEEHLANCAACRETVNGFRANMELLREIHGEPVGEAHFAAVRARVLSELAGLAEPWWRRSWVYGFAVIAAAAVVLAVVWPLPKVKQAKQTIAVVKPAETPAPVVLEMPAPAPAVRHPVRRRPKRPVPVEVQTARLEPEKVPNPAAGPLVVKLITDDPDVVIYWIADGTGDRQ